MELVALTEAEVAEGIANTALFVRAGLAPSGKEARRLFAEGGARINDEVVTEPRLMTRAEIAPGLKLSAGRKRHARVELGG
jgi:tyrosyl-tRNA synthetase